MKWRKEEISYNYLHKRDCVWLYVDIPTLCPDCDDEDCSTWQPRHRLSPATRLGNHDPNRLWTDKPQYKDWIKEQNALS